MRVPNSSGTFARGPKRSWVVGPPPILTAPLHGSPALKQVGTALFPLPSMGTDESPQQRGVAELEAGVAAIDVNEDAPPPGMMAPVAPAPGRGAGGGEDGVGGGAIVQGGGAAGAAEDQGFADESGLPKGAEAAATGGGAGRGVRAGSGADDVAAKIAAAAAADEPAGGDEGLLPAITLT